MPAFEVIGKEELAEIKHLFDESKILFRHSFDHLRNNIYKVKEFEEAFSNLEDLELKDKRALNFHRLHSF